MCGICGWVRPDGVWSPVDLQRINRVGAHRGPDGEGLWQWTGGATPSAVMLGHRRLAIIDLSAFGAQPMASPDGQLIVTFNGELYNYVELRDELTRYGHTFRSQTDTEVLLAAYAQWETACFSRFVGMWGLALVDLRRRALVLARDRLGIKPLYVWAPTGAVAFASELKQLLHLPGCRAVAHLPTVARYIETGYEGPRSTFFRDLWAFPPGCWATVALDDPRPPTPQAFWHPERLRQERCARQDAVRHTRALFSAAVARCLRADVPVGVSLSGGLDSSCVLAQMHALKGGQGGDTVAFSTVFDDPASDERPFLTRVLAATGTRGRSVQPTPEAVLADLDSFVYHHDEPPGSLSQYGAWALMREASKEGVPVLLSGQGGDELFSGYLPAYYMYLRAQVAQAPWQVLGHALAALMPSGNGALWRELGAHLRQYAWRRHREGRAVLRPSLWHLCAVQTWAEVAPGLSPAQYRLAELRQIHLPRLLKWDDRSSMAFGIEGRYPFLDDRLVEWALSLDPGMNLGRGWTKMVVRQAVGDLLPPAVQWRRDKLGFATPQARWLAGPLAEAVWRLVRRPSPRLQAVIDPKQLAQLAFQVMGPPLHPMDERHKLLMRVWFLERWLERFAVDVPRL